MAAKEKTGDVSFGWFFKKSYTDRHIEFMGLHRSPDISICLPPITHCKVASSWHIFPLISPCLELKLQLLLCTKTDCCSLPATAWNPGTGTPPVASTQHHFPLLPSPLFPHVIPKASTERLLDFAFSKANHQQLNIKYPVLKRLLLTADVAQQLNVDPETKRPLVDS